MSMGGGCDGDRAAPVFTGAKPSLALQLPCAAGRARRSRGLRDLVVAEAEHLVQDLVGVLASRGPGDVMAIRICRASTCPSGIIDDFGFDPQLGSGSIDFFLTLRIVFEDDVCLEKTR